jgi:hypothetical protein
MTKNRKMKRTESPDGCATYTDGIVRLCITPRGASGVKDTPHAEKIVAAVKAHLLPGWPADEWLEVSVSLDTPDWIGLLQYRTAPRSPSGTQVFHVSLADDGAALSQALRRPDTSGTPQPHFLA